MAVVEIEVTISPTGDVTARRDDGAYGPGGSLGVHGLDAELIRVFERWLSERGREWRLADIHAFGGLLHRALFPLDVWRWVEQSIDGLARGDRMRVQLAFPTDGMGHLAAIPWEYLRVPDRAGREGFFLATDRRCILTRYIPMELGRPTSAPAELISLLVLVSQPDDPTLGEVIAEPVLANLAEVSAQVPFDVTVRRQPTRDTLGETVAELHPDVVQFIGHGRYDDLAEQGGIALVDETRRTDWVGEAALAQILGDADDMPKLVYLHSCSGAQTDYRASFAGIAPRLIRRGVQCVVAMQYAVTNRTALAFSKGFYQGLAAGLPLDEAVQSGRRTLAVLYENDPRLLGIPVVYLYSRDALLLPREPPPALSRSPPARPGSAADPSSPAGGAGAGVAHHESPDRGVRPAKPPGDRPHRFTPLDRIPDLRPLSLREPPHLDAPPLLDLRLSHSTRCCGDPLSPPRNADISGRPRRGQTRALSAHVARPDPSGSAAIDREYTLSVVYGS
jgi:CHAT domain